MWRTLCCAGLRIMRAVRSCKDSSTKKVALTCVFFLGVMWSESRVERVAEFDCKLSDDAGLSVLRLQHEVVCHGFVFDLLSVLLSSVAEFCRFFPPRMGCDSVERVVMGGLCRCRNDTSN